jgi:hypothetical protein
VIDAESSLTDVCFTICTALADVGTTVVLSGGSAATYYAPQAYQSRDADFVITMHSNIAASGAAMKDLGYVELGGTYTHAKNRFTVEFPPGPLAIGGDLITIWETFHRGNEHLNILTRTDCVLDRLAAYYFYGDLSALVAAVAVASSGEVDYERLHDWSEREGELLRFADFCARISSH